MEGKSDEGIVGVYRRKRDDGRIGEVRVEEGKKGEVRSGR